MSTVARAPRPPAPGRTPLAAVDLTRTDPRLAGEVEDTLRTRLGLAPLARRPDGGTVGGGRPATPDHPPASARPRWVELLLGVPGLALVSLLAFVLRVVHLDHPHELVFDETYYVKGATSLLLLGHEGDWPDEYDTAFVSGDHSGLSTQADYVVHPPLGKWLLALGQLALGTDNGYGWRIAAAVAGAVGVLLVMLVARRLFRSRVLALVAGVLLAVDGVHLVLSRTGLLDVFLSTLVLAGLWLVLRDQEWARARLARRVAGDVLARDLDERGTGAPTHPWGPRLGVRWWLVAAGVALGASAGVKWSGVYAVAAFGILSFALDVQARRAVGVRAWFGAGVVRGGVPQFFALVPTAFLAYLAAWLPWFASPESYLRDWASRQRQAGADLPLEWLGGLGDALVSLTHYHRQMLEFHTGLDSEHSYMSSPIGWLVQWRPTSFYWPDPLPEGATCSAERCVQAITSVGNPLIWWAGLLALAVVLWAALRHREPVAWVILAGYGATYLPWFQYTDRTIFTFYTVAIVPYVVLALTFALGRTLGLLREPDGTRREVGALPALARRPGLVLGVFLGLVLLVSAFFWPLWTGMTVSYDFWHLHMWLSSWV